MVLRDLPLAHLSLAILADLVKLKLGVTSHTATSHSI